jgi:HPt (histidine-containing phosphotransfer) domain-containing protein
MNSASLDSNAVTPESNTFGADHDVPVGRQAAERCASDVLNLQELQDRCMGNIELMQRVLGKFQQRIPEELAELEKALELGDMAQIARVAHRVKGSSANVSARGIEQAAVEIENSSREGRIEDVSSHIEHLRAEWVRCRHVVVGR